MPWRRTLLLAGECSRNAIEGERFGVVLGFCLITLADFLSGHSVSQREGSATALPCDLGETETLSSLHSSLSFSLLLVLETQNIGKMLYP